MKNFKNAGRRGEAGRRADGSYSLWAAGTLKRGRERAAHRPLARPRQLLAQAGGRQPLEVPGQAHQRPPEGHCMLMARSRPRSQTQESSNILALSYHSVFSVEGETQLRVVVNKSSSSSHN